MIYSLLFSLFKEEFEEHCYGEQFPVEPLYRSGHGSSVRSGRNALGENLEEVNYNNVRKYILIGYKDFSMGTFKERIFQYLWILLFGQSQTLNKPPCMQSFRLSR